MVQTARQRFYAINAYMHYQEGHDIENVLKIEITPNYQLKTWKDSTARIRGSKNIPGIYLCTVLSEGDVYDFRKQYHHLLNIDYHFTSKT